MFIISLNLIKSNVLKIGSDQSDHRLAIKTVQFNAKNILLIKPGENQSFKLVVEQVNQLNRPVRSHFYFCCFFKLKRRRFDTFYIKQRRFT